MDTSLESLSGEELTDEVTSHQITHSYATFAPCSRQCLLVTPLSQPNNTQPPRG